VIEVLTIAVDEVVPLRELYRREMNCQIVHDSFPRRGFSDAYLLRIGGRTAGYGLVAKKHYPNTVNEFYVLPEYRADALPMFRELLGASGAKKVRAQTNDRLLLLMLYDCASHITAEAVLFADGFISHVECPGGTLHQVTEAEKTHVFEHKVEPVGDWVIEIDGAAVASGGALFHYNPPYGDLYMEVREDHRRRGFGSYLIQELKRICYEMGKVPAARCSPKNIASRRTLEKAGMLPCGRILSGRAAVGR